MKKKRITRINKKRNIYLFRKHWDTSFLFHLNNYTIETMDVNAEIDFYYLCLHLYFIFYSFFLLSMHDSFSFALV